MAGTLYLVGTPIGNLGDLSRRALETLERVDLIACEDTRRTGQLLAGAGIRKPMVSLHDRNERQRTPGLLDQLAAGQSIAVVSDGGTPLVNDPGWWLTRQAIDRSVPIVWIPGPAALIGALVTSGLPTDRFVFEGFLPPKQTARRKRLEALRGEPRTVIVYESPHRLVRALQDIRDVLGDVPVACARELTKLHEETVRGTASEVLAVFERRPPKGECVIALSPRQVEASVDA